MFIRGVPKPLEGSPPDGKMQKLAGKALAGGMKLPLPGECVAIAPNITPRQGDRHPKQALIAALREVPSVANAVAPSQIE